MSITVHIARAFCRGGQGGNLAGVVILKGPLPQEKMQRIATELNFSETVFISKRGDQSYKALYFTPNSPIDFCGHATLAAFGVLKSEGEVKEGRYQLETPVGPCEISVTDSTLFLSQPLPLFGETVPPEELAPLLGITAGQITTTNLLPQIVSTGLRDIMVPITDRKTLFSVVPDQAGIARLCEKYSAIGMHLFCLEDSACTAYCRNFAPLYGIPEESATGSSNGALACYLFKQGKVHIHDQEIFIFRQGDILQSPSDILIRLTASGDRLIKVECGGEVMVEKSIYRT